MSLVALIGGWGGEAMADGSVVWLDIKAAAPDIALEALSAKTGIQYVLDPGGRWDMARSQEIQGMYDPKSAIARMLACTGLTYEFLRPNYVNVLAADDASAAKTCGDGRIPQVLIQARRAQETIRRVETHALPYIVRRRSELEHSQVGNAGAALRQIPATSSGAGSGTLPGTMAVSMNGFPENSTLVLVNGERWPGSFYGGVASQPGIAAIPVSAIERIEILPITASGIYGGNATGGAVNIVLSRACLQPRVKAEIGNSFSSGAATQRVYAAQCTSFEKTGTELHLTGSYTNQEELLAGDRDFTQRGRDRIFANNPNGMLVGGAPLLGGQMNLRTVDGTGFSPSDTLGITTLSLAEIAAGDPAAAAANAGRYDTSLPESAQAFGGADVPLMSGLVTSFGSISLRQEINASLQASIDVMATSNATSARVSAADSADLYGIFVPANAPGNFLRKDVIASIPLPSADGVLRKKLQDRKVTAALQYAPAKAWEATFDITASQSTFEWEQPTALPASAAIGAGKIDVFNLGAYDFSQWMERYFSSSLKSESSMASAEVSGPLFTFPGVAGLFTTRVEYGRNRFKGGSEQIQGKLDPAPYTVVALAPQRQSVATAYSAFKLLLGPAQNGPEHRQNAELVLNIRTDEYQTQTLPPRCSAGCMDVAAATRATYRSTNPTLSLKYAPTGAITLRGSVGTGFRIPTAEESSVPTERLFPQFTFEPSAPGDGAPSSVRVTAGGNPQVKPERTRSWSVGVILAPASLENLSFTLDYSRISKTGEIVVPSELAFSDFARFRALYPESVVYSATGDSGVRTLMDVDATARNIAQAESGAWDASARYTWRGRGSDELNFAAILRSQSMLQRRPSPTAEWDDSAGISGYAPTRLGAYIDATYRSGPLTVGLSSSYMGKYKLTNTEAIESQGTRDVPDRYYQDGFVSYRWGNANGSTAGTEVQLGITNMLNSSARIDVTENRRGYLSVQDDPRGRSYTLSVTKYL